MALSQTSVGTTSVLKHVAVGTGVVALTYLTYQCVKWMRAERNLLKELKWINEQLNVKEVLLVDSDDDWPMIISRLKSELSGFKVLGLDAEWVPGNNPVALLQLATHSGLVILLGLCHLQTIPQEFKCMMLDKGILKLGVGVINDAIKLEHYGICVRGCADLRHLAKRQRKIRIGKCSLSALSQTFLGFRLVKVKSATCSNWESNPLNDKQIQYATADAQVAVRIFTKILEFRHNISSINEHHDEFIRQKAYSLCQGVVDLEYLKYTYGADYHGIFDKMSGDIKIPDNQQPTNRAYSTRKRPLYENCRIRAPDGQFLCMCDSKQAKWYVEKGLGEQISDDPITIQLLFEPTGRPQSNKDYYLQDKENVCVVCGSETGHTRKIVVPHEYRKYFPPVMKAHSRHDVLPLCTSCLHKSNLFDSSLKQHYAKKCHAPLENPKYVVDQDLKSVNSAAKALLKSPDKLPTSRRLELELMLRNYFGVDELNQKLLQDAAGIDPKMQSHHFEPHGKKVIQYVTAHEGLLEFESNWRQHFLDTMKPKFLYDGWSVDHGHRELQNLNDNMTSVIFLDTANDNQENMEELEKYRQSLLKD